MALSYRRPGVYVSESLLVNPGTTASANTVACFIGAAGKGPLNEPTLVESWSDYVRKFGSFDPVINPTPAAGNTNRVLSYLPYALYGYYQNGGRQAWVIRSAPSSGIGLASKISVNGQAPVQGQGVLTSFVLSASSTGIWGDDLQYNLAEQDTKNFGPPPGTDPAYTHSVFTLQILLRNSEGKYEVVEQFSGLTVTGEIAGTRRVDAAINDAAVGSAFVRVSGLNPAQPWPKASDLGPVDLAGGTDPHIPDEVALTTSAQLIEKIEGPVTANIVGYLLDAAQEGTDKAKFVSASVNPSKFQDRTDILSINDNVAPRSPLVSSNTYMGNMKTTLLDYTDDSRVAAYGPWIKVPHPQHPGQVIDVPPGGAVMGMMARIDTTIGMFRAPAGVIAGLSNAVGVQTKFTDTELGELNANNVNAIRSVVGAGICVMGGRTRKYYGADRYISARRTLIYINEMLRRSTQFAVFENNDQRLWSALKMSADRILRPLWEAGGLRGASAGEAFFIRCDETNNPASSVASGEVHMEVGVALEYPAEFVIIRITQFDRGTFTTEIQPNV